MSSQQESTVARHLRTLSIMFEGEVSNRNRIQYQAVIGWDPDQVGERCRLIDAAGCDGVIAIFDPDAIELGPRFIGVSVADGAMIRLELGCLCTSDDRKTVLVTKDGSSALAVEQGRFVEHRLMPTRDLARDQVRACRQLAEIASQVIDTHIGELDPLELSL